MSERPLGGAEDHYPLLTECMTDYAIFHLNPLGQVATWNAGAERILGYREEEILGQPNSRFYLPEHAQSGEPEKELNEAAAAGRAVGDRWLAAKEGRRIWVTSVTTALRDEQSNLRGFARVLRDRTEQRCAAETVQASERRYRALVENAWDGVTLIDARGTILETTPITFRGLGYSPEEYLGRSGLDLIHPDDAVAVRGLLAQVLGQTECKRTAEYRLRHKDGSWRWVEATATNLLHEPSVQAVVINHRDITEQKDSSRRKDEWLSMLAHELRGPLSPVSNAVQVLLRTALADPERQNAQEIIARQTQHLARIVDDLLEVTRLLRGQIQLRKARLNMSDMLRAAAADYRIAAEQAGMKLMIDVPETPVWVMGDAMRLGQAVGNLLDNAIKFRNGGSRIDVRVRANGEHRQAVLSVADAGIGIAPEQLPSLFDVFAQADTSLHRPLGGLGLGLSLVKGLVELHGGQVRAASPGPGRGSEFTIVLPLVDEPAALTEIPAAPPHAEKKLRILVVEDNKDAADSLRLLLTLMGHEARAVYTGPEGVKEATEWVPDVIISDIGLPGLDGYGVASQLRRHPATAGVRLIAVTGYAGEEDRRRVLASGFDFHLAKPADPTALQQLLARPL